MLNAKDQLATRLRELQPGQGLELSHHEMARLFETEMPNDAALQEAKALASAHDCTLFHEEREHDPRVAFRKNLPSV